MKEYKVGGKITFIADSRVGYRITEVKSDKIHLKPIDPSVFKHMPILDSMSRVVLDWCDDTVLVYTPPTQTLFSIEDL